MLCIPDLRINPQYKKVIYSHLFTRADTDSGIVEKDFS